MTTQPSQQVDMMKLIMEYLNTKEALLKRARADRILFLIQGMNFAMLNICLNRISPYADSDSCDLKKAIEDRIRRLR